LSENSAKPENFVPLNYRSWTYYHRESGKWCCTYSHWSEGGSCGILEFFECCYCWDNVIHRVFTSYC